MYRWSSISTLVDGAFFFKCETVIDILNLMSDIGVCGVFVYFDGFKFIPEITWWIESVVVVCSVYVLPEDERPTCFRIMEVWVCVLITFTRDERIVVGGIEVHGYADLFLVGTALEFLRGSTGATERGEEEGDEECDNGDDDEEFDEGEGGCFCACVSERSIHEAG